MNFYFMAVPFKIYYKINNILYRVGKFGGELNIWRIGRSTNKVTAKLKGWQ